MREFVGFYLNGVRQEVRGAAAFTTLAEYLRNEVAQTGTKIVCAEGDCGACTVLVGRPRGGRLAYLPINACIQSLYQIDGTHIITIEGLKYGDELHPVQAAMLEHHGAQCGYCTPGFVVALCHLHETQSQVTAQDVRNAVTGNLCRCTGYEPILRAGLNVDRAQLRTIESQYPSKPIIADLQALAAQPLQIEADGRCCFRPVTLDAAVAFKAAHPEASVVAGGTDVNVFVNKRSFAPQFILSTAGVPAWDELRADARTASIGANVTLAQLETWSEDALPELHRMLHLFGAPQIKYAGTLAGNIANGSPIADTLPWLLVAEAQVDVVGPAGPRSIPITEFYTGYRTLAMQPDELIVGVRVPLPTAPQILKLYKVSKRHHLDISTFTAAFLMQRRNGHVAQIRIAYGGVGPMVYRLRQTEAALQGAEFTEASFARVASIAHQEISPISDVRGEQRYRQQLAANMLLKFFHETNTGVNDVSS